MEWGCTYERTFTLIFLDFQLKNPILIFISPQGELLSNSSRAYPSAKDEEQVK
jgi:hypothetical protein